METVARWGSASAPRLQRQDDRLGGDGLRAGAGWILGKHSPPRGQSGSRTGSDGVTVPGVLEDCGDVALQGALMGTVGWVGVLRGPLRP